MKRAAVIGAGAAGLSAAKHLLQAGLDVTVFELGSRIGGLWVYDNDNGLSPAYQSLHLNSENRVTAYKDFPFPDDAPLYPDHEGVAAYLEAYARHFGLLPHVRFRTPVTAVEQDGRAGHLARPPPAASTNPPGAARPARRAPGPVRSCCTGRATGDGPRHHVRSPAAERRHHPPRVLLVCACLAPAALVRLRAAVLSPGPTGPPAAGGSAALPRPARP